MAVTIPSQPPQPPTSTRRQGSLRDRLAFTLAVLLWCLFPQSVPRNEMATFAVSEAFTERWSQLNRPGYCDENIRQFIRALVADGHSLAYLRVGVVLPSPGSVLRPRLARTPAAATEGWRYHAFLVFRGRVLDFDFADQPSFPRTDDYFRRMFGGTADEYMSTKQLTLVSADTFLHLPSRFF